MAQKFGRDTVAVQVAQRLGVISQDHYDLAMNETINPDDLDLDPSEVYL